MTKVKTWYKIKKQNKLLNFKRIWNLEAKTGISVQLWWCGGLVLILIVSFLQRIKSFLFWVFFFFNGQHRKRVLTTRPKPHLFWMLQSTKRTPVANLRHALFANFHIIVLTEQLALAIFRRLVKMADSQGTLANVAIKCSTTATVWLLANEVDFFFHVADVSICVSRWFQS